MSPIDADVGEPVVDPITWRSFAFDHLAAPTVVVDSAGAIVAVNEAWNLFGHLNGGTPETSGVGANYLCVCDVASANSDDAAIVGSGIRHLLAGDIDRFEHEYPCHSPDEDRWFLLQASPLDERAGVVLFHVNITGRKALETRLAREAEIDPLTGLLNRRGVAAFLGRVFADAGEDAGAVTAFYVDLDRFKPVNDQLGHASGDDVLMAVARRLTRIAREGVDLVGRLGGDEFIIVLVGLDSDDIDPIVERMRTSLQAPFQLGSRAITVGVSIGVARSRAHSTVDSLLSSADEAMYADKRQRRAGR